MPGSARFKNPGDSVRTSGQVVPTGSVGPRRSGAQRALAEAREEPGLFGFAQRCPTQTSGIGVCRPSGSPDLLSWRGGRASSGSPGRAAVYAYADAYVPMRKVHPIRRTARHTRDQRSTIRSSSRLRVSDACRGSEPRVGPRRAGQPSCCWWACSSEAPRSGSSWVWGISLRQRGAARRPALFLPPAPSAPRCCGRPRSPWVPGTDPPMAGQ